MNYKIQDQDQSLQEIQESQTALNDYSQYSEEESEKDIPTILSDLISLCNIKQSSTEEEEIELALTQIKKCTNELIKNNYEMLKDINFDIEPNHFDALIFSLSYLNYVSLSDNRFENPKIQLILAIMQILDQNPPLIDYLLTSQVVEPFFKIYNGFFKGWLKDLLIKILYSSEAAALFFISHGMIDNLQTFFTSTLSRIENLNQDQIKELNQYWIAVILILEEFVKMPYLDPDNLNKIGMFATQFLSKDFLNISKGLVAKSISLIYFCLSNPNWTLEFNLDVHFDLFVEAMEIDEWPFKKPIFDLFGKLCIKIYQWNPGFIVKWSQEALKWCENIDRNSILYISSFFDFISSVLEYQFEIFDQLQELDFFHQTYLIIHNSPFQYQMHLYNMILSLTAPQLWVKAYPYFNENSIITDLILFLQTKIDIPLKRKIICSLNQICMNEMNELAIPEIAGCIDYDIQNSIDDEKNDELSAAYNTFLKTFHSIICET